MSILTSNHTNTSTLSISQEVEKEHVLFVVLVFTGISDSWEKPLEVLDPYFAYGLCDWSEYSIALFMNYTGLSPHY